MAHRAVGPSVHDLALTLQLQVCDVIRNLRDLGVAVSAPNDFVPSAVAATLIAAAHSPEDEYEEDDLPEQYAGGEAVSSQVPGELVAEMKSFFAATLEQLQTMTGLLQEISGKLDDVATSDDIANVNDTAGDAAYELWSANERATRRRHW